jgi:hypothetical protein
MRCLCYLALEVRYCQQLVELPELRMAGALLSGMRLLTLVWRL